MTVEATPENHQKHRRRKRHKRALWIATAVFAFLVVAYLLYWLIEGRFREHTTDAYVNGNMITITPQVGGIITEILADNAQIVEEGMPLITLDRHDYEIAFNGAKAELALAVRSVSQMFLKVEELKAKKVRMEADLLRAELDFSHRKELVQDASVSREDFEHSETTLFAAEAALKETIKQLESAIAEVAFTTIPTHPEVEFAKANLRKAYLSLHRCSVRAPARGIITLRKAQVGEWVKASDPLMALVPMDQMWVDANYREVELKNLRIGQPAHIVSDMYGHSIVYHGKVVGLNPGTGSVFSVLPPQNATGNWIKIVQRIPVKISLDCEDLKKYPLVLGLSMTVKVDTHARSGLRLPEPICPKPIYSTSTYTNELVGADAIIERVIFENATYPESEKWTFSHENPWLKKSTRHLFGELK